ncbi:uncharacterized protein HD556DRAFT_1438471 [Suillus plorans]|uniref:Uncharacterized protein n=1 Tax=Suillus plorans TaxID=116603 RepID=A0A9P7DRT9_9AGAM|nr:uncharacterized protein HD556DRAFT_1438471 [Suillus plorans]KAG1801444.1 hypothetical protein HD556DRAFT_1438471 [Suillus plorans]
MSGATNKIQMAGRNRELQTYLMSLDDIDLGDEAQDKLFTQYTINTVYASYSAAQHRVRQYTHLLELLQREVDEWAMKVEKASHIMPDYKPVWLLHTQ